jgi:hypothetical protein
MGDSDTLPSPFLTRINPRPASPLHDEPEEIVAPGNAFAVVRGLRPPPTLVFFDADGNLMHAMPYGYLPIIWGHSPGVIVIEYPTLFPLMVAGTKLGLLQSRLCEYRVTWIRLCTAGQAATLDTAVTRIERLATFPSRERKARRATT